MQTRKDFFVPVTRRPFASVTHLPFLAKAQVRDPLNKPRGVRRISSKLARALWRLVHVRCGVPARGVLTFVCTDGGTISVSIDATNTVYIDYCSRDEFTGYEPAETLLVDALLPKIRVFYDIGANWGYYTWLAATNRAFAGEVHSFEISPRMNFELQTILATANFKRINLHPFGLSGHSGSADVTMSDHAHLTRITNVAGENTMRVPVCRLDDLALAPPDLIKIDVEDHESTVLEGASTLIGRHRPGILFECRSPGSADAGALFSFFARQGYCIAAIGLVSGGISLSMLDSGFPGTAPVAGNLFAAPENRFVAWFAEHR